jgi:hypothetical protein
MADEPKGEAMSEESCCERQMKRARDAQDKTDAGHLIEAYVILTQYREEEGGSSFAPEDAYSLIALQSGRGYVGCK